MNLGIRVVLVVMFGLFVGLGIMIGIRASALTLDIIVAAVGASLFATLVGVVVGLLTARAYAPGADRSAASTDSAGLPPVNILPMPDFGSYIQSQKPPSAYERTLAPRPQRYDAPGGNNPPPWKGA